MATFVVVRFIKIAYSGDSMNTPPQSKWFRDAPGAMMGTVNVKLFVLNIKICKDKDMLK